uniref:Ints3_N domain-containing protein n=1 Tax=Macrostomum lignano TaxID=282301 RepID=A0A1I8FEF8_9PLAT
PGQASRVRTSLVGDSALADQPVSEIYRSFPAVGPTAQSVCITSRLTHDMEQRIKCPVLVIQNNLARSHQQHLAIGMLDFLCRLADNYYPALAGDLRRRLRLCLLSAVERKVVHSLAHIFDLAKMDKQMHGLLRHTFADLVPAQAPQAAAAASARLPDPASAVVGGLQPTPIYDSAIIVSAASSGGLQQRRLQQRRHRSADVDAAGLLDFRRRASPRVLVALRHSAAETADAPPAPPAPSAAPASVQPDVSMEPSAAAAAATFVGSGGGRGRRRSESAEFSDAEMSDAENGAGGGAGGTVGGASGAFFDLRRGLSTPEAALDTEAQCEIMYQEPGGQREPSPYSLICRTLCQYSEDDPKRQPLVPAAIGDGGQITDTSHWLLPVILSQSGRAQSQDDKFVAYKKSFAKAKESRSAHLPVQNLNLLAQDDPRLLAPTCCPMCVPQTLPASCQNNPHLMRIIVSSIDCSQLQTMVADIMQGHWNCSAKEIIWSPPPLEQSLRHLDIMRQRLRNLSLLQHELNAGGSARGCAAAPAELRYTFIDLLALAADDLDDEQAGGRTRSLRAVPSRKAPQRAPSIIWSVQRRRAAEAATAEAEQQRSYPFVGAVAPVRRRLWQRRRAAAVETTARRRLVAAATTTERRQRRWQRRLGSSGGAGIANRRRQRAKKRLRTAAPA